MIVEAKIVDWDIPMGAYAPETKRGVINTDDVPRRSASKGWPSSSA